MTRTLTNEMGDALTSNVFRPVLIGFLDILGDPISMWTGTGTLYPVGTPDSVLNGKAFYPDQSFVDMSEIKEDRGIGGPLTIVLKANDIDADALRQIVKDRRRWRGRKAYVWMGILNETLNTVIEYPIRIKTGVMTSVAVSRMSSGVSIEIVVDEDLQNAKSAGFRWLDHINIYPNDTFSSYVIPLSNKPEGLERFSTKVAITTDMDSRRDRF